MSSLYPVLGNQIDQTSARLNEIFLLPEQQQQSVAIFMKIMSVRTALLEGRMAYQGSTILDTSTQASVGGAGERIGIPLINLYLCE